MKFFKIENSQSSISSPKNNSCKDFPDPDSDFDAYKNKSRWSSDNSEAQMIASKLNQNLNYKDLENENSKNFSNNLVGINYNISNQNTIVNKYNDSRSSFSSIINEESQKLSRIKDVRKRRNRQINWTEKEEEILFSLGKKNMKKKWSNISKLLLNKTPSQCYYHFNSCNPQIKRRNWTNDEDKKILNFYKKFGRKWEEIARCLKNRTGKQVRDRFLNRLDNSISHSKFSEKEDKLIFDLYLEHGASWSKISNIIKTRSSDMIKSRFYSSIKKRYLENFSNSFLNNENFNNFDINLKCLNQNLNQNNFQNEYEKDDFYKYQNEDASNAEYKNSVNPESHDGYFKSNNNYSKIEPIIQENLFKNNSTNDIFGNFNFPANFKSKINSFKTDNENLRCTYDGLNKKNQNDDSKNILKDCSVFAPIHELDEKIYNGYQLKVIVILNKFRIMKNINGCFFSILSQDFNKLYN